MELLNPSSTERGGGSDYTPDRKGYGILCELGLLGQKFTGGRKNKLKTQGCTNKYRTALGSMEENILGNKRPKIREQARKPRIQRTTKDFPPRSILFSFAAYLHIEGGRHVSALLSLDCLKTPGKITVPVKLICNSRWLKDNTQETFSNVFRLKTEIHHQRKMESS